MSWLNLAWQKSVCIVLLGLSSTMSMAVPSQPSTHSNTGDKNAVSGQPIRLTSLDWAPYTGAALPDGGETTHLLRQVFAQMGYQLQVDFLPWNNAVAQVHSGLNGHLA